MTWEQMAIEQIERISGMTLSDQVDLLRNSLRAFGQQVDRASDAHMQYIADRIAQFDAMMAPDHCQCCGAVAGKRHHDRTTKREVVVITRSDADNAWLCQPCRSGADQIRATDNAGFSMRGRLWQEASADASPQATKESL